jgi:transcriptional regulator with XRE-family HTH domain
MKNHAVARDANVIGRSVVKYRYQRGWTQDELVGKLQLLGCYMTRDILANIETQRGPATDKQLEFFAQVFEVKEADLFPPKRHFNGCVVGLAVRIVTRRRCAHRRRRRRRPARTPLALPPRT